MRRRWMKFFFWILMLQITKRSHHYEMIQNIASECFMPFAYGGGIQFIAAD